MRFRIEKVKRYLEGHPPLFQAPPQSTLNRVPDECKGNHYQRHPNTGTITSILEWQSTLPSRGVAEGKPFVASLEGLVFLRHQNLGPCMMAHAIQVDQSAREQHLK